MEVEFFWLWWGILCPISNKSFKKWKEKLTGPETRNFSTFADLFTFYSIFLLFFSLFLLYILKIFLYFTGLLFPTGSFFSQFRDFFSRPFSVFFLFFARLELNCNLKSFQKVDSKKKVRKQVFQNTICGFSG